jgi:hypothetical protein
MGVVATKNVRNARVYYDNAAATVSGGNRWYDAIGPGVTKYLFDGSSLPADDSTTDPTEWVDTVVEIGAGTSSCVLDDVAGGGLVITTAGNENDGWSMQLGHANAGEWVDLSTSYAYTYFGVEFAINDVDNTDVFLGAAVTDTAILGGVTDSIGFRSVDGSAVLNFLIEKDSVESTTAVDTLADDTYVYAEFLHDASAGYVYVYIDGSLVTSIADSDASFPDDELLRLSVEFLTGEAVANTCKISQMRLIHIR